MNLNGEFYKSDHFPERVEGWLNVLDVSSTGDLSLLVDKGRQLQWRPMYCVLRISSQRLSHSRNEDRGLQKKSQTPSALRVGGALDDLLKSSDALNQTHDDLDGKERNMMSYGIGNSLEDNPTNKFINFISRTSSHIKGNLRRTRSSSKLDRRKPEEAVLEVNSAAPVSFLKRTRSFSRLSKRLQNKWRGIQDRNESPTDKDKSLRSAQSHESLVGHQPVIEVTVLDPNTEIRVLHRPSVLARENCFLLSTGSVSRYYSSPASSQMYIWLKHLKRSVDLAREKEFRNLRSISILISEAKNLSSKFRYFCELAIDGQVYGRTTTKAKGEMLFWGEEFFFRNLPVAERSDKLVVNIFQDIEKKKKKDLSILIGCISLQLSELSSGQTSEKWYPVRLVSDKSSDKGKEAGGVSVRIKVKYQSLGIHPLESYSSLLQYLEINYLELIGELDGMLSAKEKEEFSVLMVNVFRSVRKSEDFLVDAVMREVEKQEKIQTLLRSNSIASKSIDAFMKLVSGKYLKGVLGGFMASLVDPGLNLEVDNVQSLSELQKRQEKLSRFCGQACQNVFESGRSDDDSKFPTELKQVFSGLKSRLVREGHSEDTVNQVVSSCFFLRFVCPAIMSPSLFGLTRGLAQDREARNCTLIAKAMQGLANFSRFGEGKEESMTFLNDFVESQTPKLKRFIGEISSFSGSLSECDALDVEVGLDLARDLSLLSHFLKDIVEKKQMKLASGELAQILSELDERTNEQKHKVKVGSRSDSLDDVADDGREGCDGGPTRRRTMREIEASGSYISLSSDGPGASSNGHVPAPAARRIPDEVFDKFSVSSASRAGKAAENGSSLCLDFDSINSGTLERTGASGVPRVVPRRSAERSPHPNSLAGRNAAELDSCLQSTYRETVHRVSGPQRATVVYAAETEIDCNDNATTSWKPLTPQGLGRGADRVQITFDVPRQGDASADRTHYAVGSLKRQAKDHQPLIFSNPGFGMKSSLSQSSLKSDSSQAVRSQSPLPCQKLISLPPGCDLPFQEERRSSPGNSSNNFNSTTIVIAKDDNDKFGCRVDDFDSNDAGLRGSSGRSPKEFQASRSMEFAVTPGAGQPSASPGFTFEQRNNPPLEVGSTPSPGDASFSGRGDMGFNLKSGSQNWHKVSGVTTMPRKMDSSKEQDAGMASARKLADLKWMLQQEREARCRMESEYERRLRISEQERRKMEAKSYEDKKLIDALQKRVRELEERMTDVECRTNQSGLSFDDSQQQQQEATRANNKTSKKWPKGPSASFGFQGN